MMQFKRSGLLVILSSPSGAGKSTLARRLMAWDPTLRFSVSATTRKPRPGEVEGEHYFFRDAGQFRDMVARGEMLEHAEVFGNFYGTPRGPVEAAIARQQDSAEIIAGRMEKSRAEISHWAEYDYVIVNDDIERSTDALITILTAERLRRERQAGLGPFVRALMQEEGR
jgi:guanylate kinase